MATSGRPVAYPGPALFLYHQRFGNEFRCGVMGLLNRAEATVFPHEEVLADRVAAVVKSVAKGADPGSLWLWCHDDNHALEPLLQTPEPCFYEATDDFGVVHQIWPVADPVRIRNMQAVLSGKELFLADGHHRFAAGWNLATIQIRSAALRSRGPHRDIDDIERNARRGALLPPKSTDFYPKLAAGLVVMTSQHAKRPLPRRRK